MSNQDLRCSFISCSAFFDIGEFYYCFLLVQSKGHCRLCRYLPNCIWSLLNKTTRITESSFTYNSRKPVLFIRSLKVFFFMILLNKMRKYFDKTIIKIPKSRLKDLGTSLCHFGSATGPTGPSVFSVASYIFIFLLFFLR